MVSTTGNPEEPKLLDQVQAKIRLKHYSIRTEQAYTEWIKRYILHFGSAIRVTWALVMWSSF